MLTSEGPALGGLIPMTDAERALYEQVVPADHFLRRLPRAVDFEAFRPLLAAARRRHPAIERKLSELVRRHGARRARYRGQPRVWYQGVLTGLVVNLKRVVRLLFPPPGKRAPTARAAWAAGG